MDPKKKNIILASAAGGIFLIAIILFVVNLGRGGGTAPEPVDNSSISIVAERLRAAQERYDANADDYDDDEEEFEEIPMEPGAGRRAFGPDDEEPE